MSRFGIFMADGCEEIEGLTVVDILRRAHIEIEMISISSGKEVVGSHRIEFCADKLKSEVDFEELDGIILPGGMPGTMNLNADETVQKVIADYAKAGKLVAAICAAPGVVLGGAGLLRGKKATCYPGFEEKMSGAEFVPQPVVVDGNIITSRGMGTAIDFALAILAYAESERDASNMAEKIIYRI